MMIIICYLIWAFVKLDFFFFMDVKTWDEATRFLFGVFFIIFIAWDITLFRYIREIKRGK